MWTPGSLLASSEPTILQAPPGAMGQMVGNVIRDSIPDHMTRAGRAAEGSADTSLAAMRERFAASVRFADLVESRGQIAVGRALRIRDGVQRDRDLT